MTQNFVPPIMMRLHGIQVNECPKFLSMNPSESDHSILLPNNLRIPLSLHGSISYIPSRLPTMIECNNLLNIELILEYLTWDPHCSSFASQESNMMNHDGSIITIYSLIQSMQQEMTDIPLIENSQTSSVLHEISPALNARTRFLKSVSHTSSSLTQSDKKNVIDHYKLAKNWKIVTETAKKT